MEFVDTHAHVHFDYYDLDPDQSLTDARSIGVSKVICVGCTLEDSRKGVEFVRDRAGTWASIGIHPHEAEAFLAKGPEAKLDFESLIGQPKMVAIGECGLDYYYNHSPKEAQQEVLKFQLELASKHNIPLIFHVRDAFEDFWPIFDEFEGLRGVIHSFTADIAKMEQILSRGLYLGLNGIMTFTKHEDQLAAARAIPLSSLLLETDAPFLTPKPYRGKVCEPKFTRTTGEFLAELRGETLEHLASATTANAHQLFKLV